MSGSDYKGVLCTDFYAGYNGHSSRHQRCWAHLLRDLAALEQENNSKPELIGWVQAVVGLYRQGRSVVAQVPAASVGERAAMARRLERAAHELGLQWAQQRGQPRYALSKRLLRHEGELFEFVRQGEVEATNNRAERALRALVIARKISGGSRSEQGSMTRMSLQTLFASWAGRGLDPLAACRAMLATKTPLPQV